MLLQGWECARARVRAQTCARHAQTCAYTRTSAQTCAQVPQHHRTPARRSALPQVGEPPPVTPATRQQGPEGGAWHSNMCQRGRTPMMSQRTAANCAPERTPSPTSLAACSRTAGDIRNRATDWWSVASLGAMVDRRAGRGPRRARADSESQMVKQQRPGSVPAPDAATSAGGAHGAMSGAADGA